MSSIAANKTKRSFKPGGQRTENNRIYAHPLPLIFPSLSAQYTPLNYVLGLFGFSSTAVLNPHCEGVFDVATCSVWVVTRRDAMLLWQRGFFGKGDLSRSEPTWLAQHLNARKQAGRGLTAEEVRAKRRAERRQFKLDRARAMAAAAAEAEAAFAEGRVITPGIAPDGTRLIPSAATWKPAEPLVGDQHTPDDDFRENEKLDPQEADEEPLEDIEHLQLMLPEAFFLLWNLDCLSVVDPQTNIRLSLSEIWKAFQDAYCRPLDLVSSSSSPQRFDNPFLVNYVVYHYYRSLGWVVKSGLKFCVDYLLYKRGPVFAHAEFAVVLCPVYEDPQDREASPFNLPNATPFSWSWLSTLNRVNSQVQKTLVLAYITIPALSKVSVDVLTSPACFVHYSVREVVVRRFVPARMRD